jgi:iron(III) transport system substrate-binding protein
MELKTVGKGHSRMALVSVFVLAMTASLSACGSGGNSTSSSPPGPSSSGSSQAASDLKAAAEQEGKLVWYTTFAADDIKGMIDAFNADYPDITVQALRLTGAELPPRILAEQKGGKFNADVVNGDAPNVVALINAGALAPYDPPNQTALPGDLKLPRGYTGVNYLHTQVIAYNPTVVRQAGLQPPTSWQDFVGPKWRGKFSVNATSLEFYESLIALMGHDDALALLKKIGENDPRFDTSHTQSVTEVQSGEPMAAAVVYGYKAASEKAKTPDQLDFVNPNPMPCTLNLIDIVKNAPHPNAAKLFEDWMVSKAGQTAMVKASNQVSLRDDVGNDETVFDVTNWKPVWVDSNLSNEQYNTYTTEMKEALQAP